MPQRYTNYKYALLGFRFQVSGFKFQVSSFKFQVSRAKGQGPRAKMFKVQGSKFKVQGHRIIVFHRFIASSSHRFIVKKGEDPSPPFCRAVALRQPYIHRVTVSSTSSRTVSSPLPYPWSRARNTYRRRDPRH